MQCHDFPSTPLRSLFIDDDRDDYELTRRLLQQIDGMSILLDWAPSFEDGIAALLRHQHMLYLVDYNLGARNGLELLDALRLKKIHAPIIMLTGCGDRAVDLAAMQAGADDYLEKERLTPVLLERSIRYALQRARVAQEHEQHVAELEDDLARITPLKELIPICAACKKVRDSAGLWQHVEEYLSEHTGMMFSHGMCPQCASELFSELIERR